MALFTFVFMALVSLPAFGTASYKTESIMLLQPDTVMKDRVPSPQALVDYINRSQAAAESALASQPITPASGFIVFAVRPGSKTRIWLDFKPALPQETADGLRNAIQSVPSFAARNGTVLFALRATLWGAPSAEGFPYPSEWGKAMEGQEGPMEAGELVDKLAWPKAIETSK